MTAVGPEMAADEQPVDAGARGGAWARRAWIAAVVAALCFVSAAGTYAWTQRRTPGNAVDRGFLFDMATHHEQALALANLELTRAGTDPRVQVFAREVLTAQSYELGLIDRHLAERGLTREDRPPTAMEWMGMGSAPAAMPGMATRAQLDALAAARGRDADALFLTLLEDHHQGGIHMAEGAATLGQDDEVRALARRIARNQRLEVQELEATRARLGLPDGEAALGS